MVPQVFMILARLPLSANGKIDRNALPAPVETKPREDVFEEPRTEIESWFRDLWRELLGVERIGVHDRFFTLGGDSVQAIQFLARLRQAGLDLTPREFFEHQTIAELAAVARRLDTAPVDSARLASSIAVPAPDEAFSRAEMEPEELRGLIEEFGEDLDV
jgi:aryl carrier-like protein